MSNREKLLKLWNFYDGRNRLPSIVEMLIDKGCDGSQIHHFMMAHFNLLYEAKMLFYHREWYDEDEHYIECLKSAYTEVAFMKFKR